MLLTNPLAFFELLSSLLDSVLSSAFYAEWEDTFIWLSLWVFFSRLGVILLILLKGSFSVYIFSIIYLIRLWNSSNLKFDSFIFFNVFDFDTYDDPFLLDVDGALKSNPSILVEDYLFFRVYLLYSNNIPPVEILLNIS